MSKISLLSLSVVLTGLLACDGGPPKADKQAKAATKAEPTPTDPPKTDPVAKPDPIAPTTAAPPIEPPPEPEPIAPTTAGPIEAPTTAAMVEPPVEPDSEAQPSNAGGGWKAPEGVDIRSDAAVPPGTPAANAEAFKALPQTKVDGPPVSGIASNGLHFDALVVGRGWEKSHCVEATNTFTIGTDDRVNICVRVVHPADADETLTVEWSKVGAKTTRKSNISVKAMHAYLTRGYLPIKPGYEGDWQAVVKAPDGTVLATLPFKVE